MLCSLANTLRISADDVRTIETFFERSANDEKEKSKEKANKPTTSAKKFDGLVEPDADRLLTDDEVEDETEIRPQWSESASDTESGSRPTDQSKRKDEHNQWLRSSLISAAPQMEIVALSVAQGLVILERVIDSKTTNADRLQITATVTVESVDSAAYITSLLVLPIASTRRTAVSAVDSTAILVGLSDGYVNVYTERGVFIFRERVAYKQVRHLRIGTGSNGQVVGALSGKRIALIDSTSLHSALKTARVEVAHGKRNAIAISDDLQLEARPIEFNGLSLARPLDFHLLGVERSTIFAQYRTTTFNKRSLRQLETSNVKIFTATARNYAAFARLDGDGAEWNPIRQAYDHITERISAAVPSFGVRSFFGFGVSRKDQPQKKMVADLRNGRAICVSKLSDTDRRYERSAVAFNDWPLMAVCDDMARVLLLDRRTGAVLRVWKGYRSARCAFVESVESSKNDKKPKRALFLVIFAPKRGLLEVFAMQNGPRVAAFNVDPRGRLLSIQTPADGTLQNANNSTGQTLSISGPTAMFLASDGSVFTIQVPFHLAALDVNATQMHDESLLKEARLDHLLDNVEKERAEAVTKVFAQLKTADCRQRFIERFIQSASQRMSLEEITKTLELCGNQASNSSLTSYLNGLKRLVEIYVQIQPNPEDTKPRECDYDKLLDLLSLSIEDFNELHLDVLLKTERQTQLDSLMSLTRFRDQFAFDNLGDCNLGLAPNVKFDELGCTLFISLFTTTAVDSVEVKYEKIFNRLNIPISDVLRLFLSSWLSSWNVRPWDHIENAISILTILSDQFETTTKLSMTVERAIYHSKNARAAFFLLLALRLLEHQQQSSSSTDFETLDDSLAWHLVLSKHLAIQSLIEDLPDAPSVGLDQLSTRGYGFYRELIGEYVAKRKLPIEQLERVLGCNGNERETTPKAEDNSEDRIEILLKSIVEQFSRSFPAPFVFADCAWECAASWCKDETARSLKCLEMSVGFLERIFSTARLQHGLAFMVWDTFVRSPFERLYVLWRDSPDGRMAKDRVLRTEIFCSEFELPKFFASVRRLLRTMQQSVSYLESQPAVEHDYESFMTAFFTSSRLPSTGDSSGPSNRRRPTLCELAANQRPVNYHLALHHAHLATVLELCCLLGLRISVERVFDQIAQRALFGAFHEHPLIPIGDVPDKLKHSRQRFLEEAVEAIGVQMDDDYHERWERVKELCTEWELDEDLLRIKEIVMLHESRYDSEAQKFYPIVGSRLFFATQLAKVAIGRFKSLLDVDRELKQRAEKRLKSTARDATRQLDDRWAANFEPNAKETLDLVNGVLNLFGSPKSASAANRVDDDRISYSTMERDRRVLSEIRDFLRL
ncbi:hypothetical protein M3Y95_01057800 [Aphelenchoides besseyi]|nr:hypothetical protein M3Y95_01057800 [Aphelenchoides besseyi]